MIYLLLRVYSGAIKERVNRSSKISGTITVTPVYSGIITLMHVVFILSETRKDKSNIKKSESKMK